MRLVHQKPYFAANIIFASSLPNMPIMLRSNDGEVFEVDPESIKLSTMLRTMFQDLKIDLKGSDMPSEPIPIQNVSGDILRKVIQWCTYHSDDAVKPHKNDLVKQRNGISKWDNEFLKIDQGTLYELILAANYLEIEGLIEVACLAVANMIMGKSPDEIRRTFGIKNDFTPQEEEQLQRENAWCQDD